MSLFFELFLEVISVKNVKRALTKKEKVAIRRMTVLVGAIGIMTFTYGLFRLITNPVDFIFDSQTINGKIFLDAGILLFSTYVMCRCGA